MGLFLFIDKILFSKLIPVFAIGSKERTELLH